MSGNELSRREVVGALVGSSALVWARTPWPAVVAAARAASQQPPPPFQVLSAADAADLEAITAQIIPTDDTPGAKEARVVHFIDRGLATFAKDELPRFVEGLAVLRTEVARRWPGAASFAALSPRRQEQLLTTLDQEKSPFFDAVRAATITGMFAHPKYGGNYGKAGWRLLGFDDRAVWQPPFGYYDRG